MVFSFTCHQHSDSSKLCEVGLDAGCRPMVSCHTGGDCSKLKRRGIEVEALIKDSAVGLLVYVSKEI
jgi:hypothetical protein